MIGERKPLVPCTKDSFGFIEGHGFNEFDISSAICLDHKEKFDVAYKPKLEKGRHIKIALLRCDRMMEIKYKVECRTTSEAYDYFAEVDI